MFLINAIYFKGSWRDKFDPAETKDDTFHGIAGDQPVKLMHRHGKLSFAFNTQFTAADLPYGNSTYSMTVLLPNPGTTIDQLAASLQSGAWTSWIGQFHEMSTDIWLPKLKLEWQRDLNDDLKAMGMRDAFIPDGADFTRMSSTQGRHLFIDKVKQKTYVDINEEGTEAAAVTSVGISLTSLPPQLRVDRPYIFVIRERLSGTILFMGKIVRMP
jgi:serpin B